MPFKLKGMDLGSCVFVMIWKMLLLSFCHAKIWGLDVRNKGTDVLFWGNLERFLEMGSDLQG